jgi:hypothetical protein
MNPYFIPYLPVHRWLVGKGVVFALLALLAHDGGLSVNPALALSGVTITPSAVSFTGTVGPGPLTIPVTFTNSGASSVSFTWTDSIPWIKAGYPSGTLTPGQSRSFTITANISSLAAGTYNGIATVTAGGITKQVPVSLALSSTTATPTIGTNPAALTFVGTQGGANPTAQLIAISNPGGGTLAWTASDNAPWLMLTTASGTNAGSVSAAVNLSGLTAGNYTGAVSIAATGTTSKTLPVTLTVTSSSPAAGVTVTPSTVAFTGTVGPGPLTLPVTFTNSGASSVSFTWTDSIPWIKAGYPAGTLSPGQSRSFTITANISGLAVGTYNGIATVTAGGITKQVPVSLALSAEARPPTIGLNTTSLGFAGTVGGTNASAQTIAVSNVGGGTLSWATSDNAAWLTLSPSSGVNSGTVTANVNLTSLAAGTYNATVAVTAPGAPSKTIPVTLTVTASTNLPTIGLSPTSLTFTATVGGTSPATKPISISKTVDGTLSWTASDNAAWLTLGPVSGTNSGTVIASVNTNGLAAGTYNATITVTASGSTNSPRQIPVSLTLNATTAGTAILAWNASTESDLTGYKVYRGTGSGTYGAPLATLPKTMTNYTVAGLQNGTTYFFVITAYDSSGNESTYSNEVSKSIF